MSLSATPLLDIKGAGDPIAVAQDNFEELAKDLYAFTGSRQSGAATLLIGPPTSGARVLNERWVDAWGASWRCTVAGSPGTWWQETPAARSGEPSTGTIPTGYLILDVTGNIFRRKVHLGGYRWASLDTVVSVATFGAKGDGVTDDILALRAAVSSLPAVGGAIYLPPGAYRTTASWVLPRRVTVYGDGLTSDYTSGFRAPACIVGDGNFDKVVLDHECALRDLQIDGAVGNGSDGVYVYGAHVRVTGVTISNQGGDGLRVGGKVAGKNADLGTFQSLHLLKNLGRGVYVHDADGTNINANRCVFNNLDIRENGSDGVTVENAIDNDWIGVCTQINGGAGIRLKSGAKGQQFFFPYTEADTAGTVLLESGSQENVIFGVRQGTSDAIVDSGTRNTVIGRDYGKQGDLIWHKLFVRELRTSILAYVGVLSLTQVANDAYELRNTNGNNTCTLTITADGSPGIGILNVDRLATGRITYSGMPVYANNAAALAGGLAVGEFYRTGANPDPVCIVH